MTGNESTECFSYQDLQNTRIEKDRADVKAYRAYGEQLGKHSMPRSVRSPQELLCHQTGEKAYHIFRAEHLEKAHSQVP